MNWPRFFRGAAVATNVDSCQGHVLARNSSAGDACFVHWNVDASNLGAKFAYARIAPCQRSRLTCIPRSFTTLLLIWNMTAACAKDAAVRNIRRPKAQMPTWSTTAWTPHIYVRCAEGSMHRIESNLAAAMHADPWCMTAAWLKAVQAELCAASVSKMGILFRRWTKWMRTRMRKKSMTMTIATECPAC